MSKILTVARAEYVKATRSKAFIVGILMTPLMFGGSLLVMALNENTVDVEQRRFVVVDRSEALYETLEDAAEERNRMFIWDDEEPETQVRPEWTPSLYDGELDGAPMAGESGEAEGSLELELSKQVKDKEILGFVIMGKDLFTSASDDPDGELDREFSWHTETPTYKDLPNWIERKVNTVLRDARFKEANLDQSLVNSLTRSENLRTLGLTKQDKSTGQVIEAEEDEPLAIYAVPGALALMLFMLVVMSVPALMNNVLEEKMQKIAEVLVSSVTPFELLMGKLLATVGVSLTLGFLYIGTTLVFVHNVDGVPPQVLDAISPGILLWFSFFLLLALLIFGSMFSALGSACSELQDAQTLMMPAMMLMMMPMFFLGPIIENPGGSLAKILSLIPPFTPMIMFLRMAIPPGVEWWELTLAVILTLAFTTACVTGSAKIFRIGILSQGQTPSYKNLVGWLFSK